MGNRAKPWLADHVIFFGYRWIAWLASVALLLAQRRIGQFMPALLLTGLVNVLSMLFAQRYVRMAQRNPLTMGVDIVYTVLVLVFTGGWASPLVFYGYSGLVLPGLLYGWRGRIMAALSFMWLYPAALWAAGEPPSDLVFGSPEGWSSLALQLAGPLLFASLFPGFIELLRRAARGQRSRKARAAAVPRLDRSVGGDTLHYLSVDRASGRQRDAAADDSPQALQATKVRITERGADDFRRVLFMPLPSVDMDLGEALDALAHRFGQHTGTPAQVTLLGRTRLINPIHRGLMVRLAQEALLNIQQHAHAASASLTQRYDSTSVALLIQDDGVGLLDGTHQRPGLHALRAMQYRMAEFGGRLDVFETEGGGVTVRATLPLE